ncbi:hypothetical protein RJT34_23938 [Clitoria ternatea]|uniref:Uncharacterized protein n=1 Tax=Clitoria ternatea TaxID=43366 RepID=A0AAN9FNM8_CLITE
MKKEIEKEEETSSLLSLLPPSFLAIFLSLSNFLSFFLSESLRFSRYPNTLCLKHPSPTLRSLSFTNGFFFIPQHQRVNLMQMKAFGEVKDCCLQLHFPSC